MTKFEKDVMSLFNTLQDIQFYGKSAIADMIDRLVPTISADPFNDGFVELKRDGNVARLIVETGADWDEPDNRWVSNVEFVNQKF